MKKKILIVDDEVFISEQLKLILTNLGYEVSGVAYDTESASKSLNNVIPDLVILDIKMQGVNKGFEIAEYINAEVKVPIVFLTSFADAETVREAAQLSPDGYLLKPFNEKDIFSSIEVILNKKKEVDEKVIYLKDGHLNIKVRIDEMYWVKSDGHYIEVQTKQKRIVKRTSIESFISKYELDQFARVHRSYAVNLDLVDSISAQFLRISNSEIPLSRKYRKAITQRLQS